MLESLILNNHLESAFKYYEVSNRSYKQQLISFYSKGKRQEFLKIFHLLRKEEKLQFYVRVYFLIYNIHPTLKAKTSIPEEQISAFRDYLDNKGNDLAKTNQFLEFYALPYVKKPHEHPSFKSLFKKQWVNNLTQKLNLFLQDQHKRLQEASNFQPNSKEESQVKKVRELSSNNSDQTIKNNMKALQDKNKRLFEEVELYKQKFTNLQLNNQALFEGYKSAFMESHNKWLQITKELTNNSRVLIQLIVKTQSSLTNHRRFQRIKKRTQKFEKMVKKQLDELLNQSQDLSIFDKPSVNEISHSASMTPNINQRNITTFIAIDQYIPINYFSLIKDFKKMTNEQKIKILQGFSWRIIKSKNKEIRRQIIVGLIVNDLLGLMNGQIQDIMFNENLMYYVIKLFLYISQDSYGTKVLFRNGRLYKQIVDLIPLILQIQRYDCLQVILQILQNIWHNKQILIELINLSIISICTNLLQDENVKNSDELLESISTLLLNTTAINEGLDAFQKEINIFYILCQAFKEANDSNRNLIGAIIYALLGRKNMWKLAQEAKLPNFIEDLIRIDLRSNKQQLYLIQQKLVTFQKGKIMNSIEYEEESFDSNLQEQIFERNQEELSTLQDYIKGHQILNTKYFLKNKEAHKQMDEINDIMKQFASKKYDSKGQANDSQNDKKKKKGEMQKMKKQMFEEVRFPEIKQKNNNYMVQAQESLIHQTKEKANYNAEHQYYSYKSPNFKQNEVKQHFSLMNHPYEQEKVQIFDIHHELTQEKPIKGNNRYQNPKNKDSGLKQQQKKINRSKDKPQYRIKKSSSLQKIQNKRPYINAEMLKNKSNKHEPLYQPAKNISNSQHRNFQSIKSPGQKKSRQEVLKQLNKELKAEKKAQEQDRKVSAKNIGGHPQQANSPQRQNLFIKKDNLMLTQEQIRAFASKPKIRRTPPHQDE